MSNYNFYTGQAVRITATHNHLIACNDTTYQVGSINRVAGVISVQLLKDGRSVGAVPQGNLIKANK